MGDSESPSGGSGSSGFLASSVASINRGTGKGLAEVDSTKRNYSKWGQYNGDLVHTGPGTGTSKGPHWARYPQQLPSLGSRVLPRRPHQQRRKHRDMLSLPTPRLTTNPGGSSRCFNRGT